MADHATRIKKQANTAGNLWEHAVHDLVQINKALIGVRCVTGQADSLVISSHIDVLAKQHKPEAVAMEFLTQHITVLTTATDTLTRPMSELIKIHNIKLQGIASEGKAQATPEKLHRKGAEVSDTAVWRTLVSVGKPRSGVDFKVGTTSFTQSNF